MLTAEGNTYVKYRALVIVYSSHEEELSGEIEKENVRKRRKRERKVGMDGGIQRESGGGGE